MAEFGVMLMKKFYLLDFKNHVKDISCGEKIEEKVPPLYGLLFI